MPRLFSNYSLTPHFKRLTRTIIAYYIHYHYIILLIIIWVSLLIIARAGNWFSTSYPIISLRGTVNGNVTNAIDIQLELYRWKVNKHKNIISLYYSTTSQSASLLLKLASQSWTISPLRQRSFAAAKCAREVMKVSKVKIEFFFFVYSKQNWVTQISASRR